MTLSPRLPSGLACDTAVSGPAGAELSRMTDLALSRGARSVAIGGGRSAAAAAALGTRRAIGLVGAHNLQGLAGATADGGTWTVCDGSIQAAPSRRGDHGMTASALVRHLPRRPAAA
jgi:hypothetical protein